MSVSETLSGANYLKFILNTTNSDECVDTYQRLTDFIPGLVYVYDTEKKNFGYVNKKFTELLGFEHHEFNTAENKWKDIIFKQDEERFYEELEKFHSLKDDEAHTFQNRFNKKDGSWRYFKTSGKVWKRNSDGKAEALLMIAEDVTDVLASEEELVKSKQLIRETEQMNKYGMFTYDLSSDCFSWSDGMYDLLELKKEEITDKINRAYFRNFLPANERNVVNNLIEDFYKKGEDFEHEYSVITAKGNEKTLINIVKVVKDDEGKIVKTIGTARDVTRERNFQRELQKNIKDLNRSNNDLEEFAYVASHDMQEPLRKITTFSSRLLEKFASQLGDEGKMFLTRIDASASSMRMLIENLLEISKTARSKQPFLETDLNEILKQTIADLELKIAEYNVVIHNDELPFIEGVASLLQQLFNNIISNAIKFKSQGLQPEISVRSEEISKPERERLLLPEKIFYKITFADNGIGFEPEYVEKIFQIFQRLHGKAEYPGSGIGLAICKKIVEKHNGVIYAESLPEVGSKFIIILPKNH